MNYLPSLITCVRTAPRFWIYNNVFTLISNISTINENKFGNDYLCHTMTSFYERQKSLFNTLKQAEDEYSFSKTNKACAPNNDNGVIDIYSYRKLKHEMKPFRNRESIFKRPEATLRECLRARTVPDHIKNPQRYTYYSLSDVTTNQMSDSTNISTALAFLSEMEDREAANIKKEENRENEDGLFKKPVFLQSTRIKKEPIQEDKPFYKNGKLIMPECIVGAAPKKSNNQLLVKREHKRSSDNFSKVELKLGHLYEDDAEDPQ